MPVDPRLIAAGVWGAAFLLHTDRPTDDARNTSALFGDKRFPALRGTVWEPIQGPLSLPGSTTPTNAASLMDAWLNQNGVIQNALTRATDEILDTGGAGTSAIVKWTELLDRVGDKRVPLAASRVQVAQEISVANQRDVDPGSFDSSAWANGGRESLRGYVFALMDAIDHHAQIMGFSVSFGDALGATLLAGAEAGAGAARGVFGFAGELLGELLGEVVVVALVGAGVGLWLWKGKS